MARQKKITGRQNSRKNDLGWMSRHIHDKGNKRELKKHLNKLYQFNKSHANDVYAYLYKCGEGWLLAYTARPKQKDCERFRYRRVLLEQSGDLEWPVG